MVGRRVEAAIPLNSRADRWRVALATRVPARSTGACNGTVCWTNGSRNLSSPRTVASNWDGPAAPYLSTRPTPNSLIAWRSE
jgi:hypothetical protein